MVGAGCGRAYARRPRQAMVRDHLCDTDDEAARLENPVTKGGGSQTVLMCAGVVSALLSRRRQSRSGPHPCLASKPAPRAIPPVDNIGHDAVRSHPYGPRSLESVPRGGVGVYPADARPPRPGVLGIA